MSKKNNVSDNIGTFRKPKLTMGERFKDARTVYNQHGKQSIDAVSKAVTISKSTLSDIENDTRDPGAKVISVLAKHYGVSTDYLLGLSDIRTPETTAQAVICYTGLSEDNVKTLHEMSQRIFNEGLSKRDGNIVSFDGNKPFIDCLNDLLEALYNDRTFFMNHYIRLRRKAMKNETVDFWYVMGDCGGPIPGFEHMEYSDPKTQIEFDNELIEYHCIKIAKTIEKSFLKKYLGTPEDIKRFRQDIDEEQARIEAIRNEAIRRKQNGTY